MNPKIILLTGGSSGIGLEISLQLMEKGMRVYSASRRMGIPRKAAKGEGEIIPIRLDVNDEVGICSAVDHILKENSHLDVVICNAGNGIAGAVEDTSVDEAKYQLETNFFGAIKTIQACLPIFRQQRFGQIVAISSLAAVVPIPYQAFYSAGKSALLIFMQSLSMEVESFGIQCCTILPGDTKTGFTNARTFTQKSTSPSSPYIVQMKRSVSKMEYSEQNGTEASLVAKVVTQQVTKSHMNEIVVPGAQYKLIYRLLKIAPVKFRLWLTKKVY